MKRGLKDAKATASSTTIVVTTYSPMKRGLKDCLSFNPHAILKGYNLFPDEKGTESQRC